MDEIWKDIEGYEGYYQVSNKGRVKSLCRVVIRKCGKPNPIQERILKQAINQKNGYSYVNLFRNGKGNVITVHQLVAKTFLQNPENKPTIDHINGNKLDNSVDNLRWATYCEQQDNEATTRKRPILQYTLDGKLIKEWLSINEIQQQLKFDNGHICACCKGVRKTAYGYKWQYAA